MSSNLASIAWALSSPFYDYSYSPLVDEIDEKVLFELGDSIKGTVLDACCGTGVMSLKALDAGASFVYSTDSNGFMLNKLKKKLKKRPKTGDGLIYKGDIFRSIDRLAEINQDPFDVVFFRRCLYFGDEKNSELLETAYKNLSDGGKIVVVHPETDLRVYCDNGNGGFAPTHFLRRALSKLNDCYEPMFRGELESLCMLACPDAEITSVDELSRPAYNVLILGK